MSLQKAGGTNVDNLSTPASASALIDTLETQLVNAGWTIISGAGTDAIKFESAATSDSMQTRIVTGVSGSDVTLELRNPSESATGATGNIRLEVDGTSDWRLMANRYAFVVHQNTAAVSINSTGAKKWALAGTLYLESWLTPTTTEVGFLMGDHRSTTSSQHYESLRAKAMQEGTPANSSLLYNGTIIDANNTTSANSEEGDIALCLPTYPMADTTSHSGSPTKVVRYASGENVMADAMVAWGQPDRITNYREIHGQLFDVIIALDDNLVQGQTVTIGSDQFRVVSDAAGAGSTRDPYAMLWLMPAA